MTVRFASTNIYLAKILYCEFSIKNLHVRSEGLLQGRAKYEILVVESGGRIQGELGISKQNKLLTKKNGKDKINSKNATPVNPKSQ